MSRITVPQNLVTVVKEETAAFDIDASNCFTPLCPDELPVPGGDEIVDELNAQAEKADWRGFSKCAHPANADWATLDPEKIAQPLKAPDLNTDVMWPPHGVPGTLGFELIPGLPRVEDYDILIYKGMEKNYHPYGACFHDLGNMQSTGLIEQLNAKNISTVIIGGLAAEYCVKMTVLQLLAAGFRVILNVAAIRGLDDQAARDAIAEMKVAGAEIVNCAADIIAR